MRINSSAKPINETIDNLLEFSGIKKNSSIYKSLLEIKEKDGERKTHFPMLVEGMNKNVPLFDRLIKEMTDFMLGERKHDWTSFLGLLEELRKKCDSSIELRMEHNWNMQYYKAIIKDQLFDNLEISIEKMNRPDECRLEFDFRSDFGYSVYKAATLPQDCYSMIVILLLYTFVYQHVEVTNKLNSINLNEETK